MSVPKIIVTTIVASFFLYDHVQTDATNNITLERYLGIWYQVGKLFPERYMRNIDCEWFNAKLRFECDGCFKESYGKLITGRDPPKVLGLGVLENDKLIVTYDNLANSSYVYIVTSHNNDQELLLREKYREQYSKVLSRKTTASDEIKRKFERLAAHLHRYAVFVDPENCQSY